MSGGRSAAREDLTRVVAHRPYPLPEAPWIMKQTWVDLMFAHWRVDASALRVKIPAALELDLFDGSAWLAVAPFKVVGLHPRFLPPLPFLGSRFPELNVRTYVTRDGKPGVFFFSLDAGSSLAVEVARTFFRLPYYRAYMRHTVEGDSIRFTSRRMQRGAELAARYRPVGEAFHAQPGTLDHFLIERYCLYTGLLGPRIFRVEIHHPPWHLQRAEATIERNTMAAAAGLTLPDDAPLLHFSRRQPTLVWAPELVARAR